MSNLYRSDAYIRIDDSGTHAELRVVIADLETQEKVDADVLKAIVRLFTAAMSDMKRLRQRELTPPVKPHQFFAAAAGRK